MPPNRGRHSVPRPKGWGPEHVLSRLRAGDDLAQILRDGVAELGGKTKLPTLKNDVNAWKKTQPDFAAEYISLQGHKFQFPAKKPKFDPEKQELFFTVFESCGGQMEKAVQRLASEHDFSITPDHIYAKINPSRGDYDGAFAERYHRLEAARYHQVREKAFELAESGGKDKRGSERLIEFLLKTGMPHLHSERQIVEHMGEVKHLHGVDRAALAAFEERVSRLTSTRLSLPDPDVIDAEYEEASA